MATPTKSFLEAITARRSIYALTPRSPIPHARIQELLNVTMLQVPSAFNSQTVRAALLLGDSHRRFWSMAGEILIAAAEGKEAKEKVKGRMGGFEGAVGTVLFMQDVPTLEKWTAMPTYGPLFPPWADQSNGMHQHTLWTALSAEGLGCNLQHYHYEPEVEKRAKAMFDLPEGWEMKAQLVFGGIQEGMEHPKEKEKTPLGETVVARE